MAVGGCGGRGGGALRMPAREVAGSQSHAPQCEEPGRQPVLVPHATPSTSACAARLGPHARPHPAPKPLKGRGVGRPLRLCVCAHHHHHDHTTTTATTTITHLLPIPVPIPSLLHPHGRPSRSTGARAATRWPSWGTSQSTSSSTTGAGGGGQGASRGEGFAVPHCCVRASVVQLHVCGPPRRQGRWLVPAAPPCSKCGRRGVRPGWVGMG